MTFYFHGNVHHKKRERMRQRRLLVIPIALLLSFLAYFCVTFSVIPPAAQAHAYVIGSDPIDGSTIDKVPSEVHIFFNASISTLSSAHIYSIQNGNLVDINATPSSVTATDAKELIIPLKTPASQPKGSYEVLWTAVASNDGTTTYGIIGFDVGYSGTGTSGVATLGPTSSNALASIQKLDITALLSIGWEWLTFMALTFWIGLLVIEQIILAEGRGTGLFPKVRKQTYPLEWLCLTILLFGECITLILRMVQFATVMHEQAAQPLNTTMLLRILPDTTYGWIWLLRLLLIIIAIIFLRQTKPGKDSQQEQDQEPLTNFERLSTQDMKPSNPRRTIQLTETPPPEPITAPARNKWTWLLLAGLISLTFIFTSSVVPVLHPTISAFVFGWLYLIAQGIWLGGSTYLAFVLLPLLTGVELEYNTETLTVVLRRLTPLLLAGMSIQIVSGLFLGEASISDTQQLFNDPFGRVLLVQIVLTAFTVFLSLYALSVIRPKFTHQALLIPVVKADLPTRRIRQSKLSSTGRLLKLTTKTLTICGAIIILCSALQSFFAPPINYPVLAYTNAQATPATTNSINTETQQMGDLTVTVQLLPDHIGYTHTVIVIITDSTGQQVSDAQVKISTDMQIMAMGTNNITINKGNPLYVATFDKNATLDMAGVWQIKLAIQRPGQQSLKKTFTVTLAA
jgi:methionine-rich copper-binding protein CopC/putative copper export protein